jgi:tetratricopeptide (TPR) repeat protein
MAGQYEAAIESFEALATDPKSALSAQLGLAEAQLRIGGYADAIKTLEALDAGATRGASGTHPTGSDSPRDSAPRHLLLARACLAVGRYDDAQQHAREAFRIDDDFAGARLLLGRILEMLGKRDEAIEVYCWFDNRIVGGGELPRDAEWVTNTGLGFLRFSVLTGTSVPSRTQHVLNELLQVAYTRIDRGYWPARVAAADLLRDKHNNDEEDGSVSDYHAALKINPHLPEAHVGLGEVALEGWGFEEVEKRADLALKVNPNFVPAMNLLAEKYLLERRYQQAVTMAEKALAINPHDLTALSLAAAAYACTYDQEGVDRMQSRVSALNARCALYHRTLGDALSGIRQYASSEKQYLQAIEYDPTDANARTELGMMYMQWGHEDKARDALDSAWTLDPYNERTKYTLDLLDKLHKFARHETAHFIVKYDAAQDPGLGEYVADYLESIYAAVTGDFDTPLDEKTTIEFFPTQKSFAVRITGKPWIYTVGASTGSVIALAVPRESTQTMGRYNLARVLKHEFTHTVTLAATHNRIPHWFTEGLAVYEEDSPRSYDWAEGLADVVRRDRLFTLESIDWGFIRPKRPSDRQMAYAQSEWMVEYIVERFGYDAIQKMIKLFRDGKTQPETLRELFNLETTGFDSDFTGWARRQVATWGCPLDLTPPGDVPELRTQAESDSATADTFARLAKAEFDEADYERAQSAAVKALEKDPDDRRALEVMVKVLGLFAMEEAGDTGKRQYEHRTLPLIERLLTLEPDNRAALKHLGTIALRRKESDIAADAFQKLQRVCPMDPASWRGLAAIHLDRSEDDMALPQLIELARIEQNDPAVPRKVADIVFRRGDLREAQYWYRQALFIDPFDTDIHDAMGKASMRSNDYRTAFREYEMATRLDPSKPSYFESAALAAFKLGDRDLAKRYADRAIQLNPASTIGSLFDASRTPPPDPGKKPD